MNDGRGPRPIRTFGRTGGRALSGRQQALIDDLLPTLSVPLVTDELIDVPALFGPVESICLEIGFGGGEHLVEQARRAPQTGFIGCEPYIEGMAKALTSISELGLKNVRLHMDDVRALMLHLPDSFLDQVYIMFPDPWPKMRQRKRRLIQPEFLEDLVRICKPGAAVRFATDVASYADEALLHFTQNGAFAWTAQAHEDWTKAPRTHVPTRYEAKRLGDCEPVWFDFVVASETAP